MFSYERGTPVGLGVWDGDDGVVPLEARKGRILHVVFNTQRFCTSHGRDFVLVTGVIVRSLQYTGGS